MPLAVLAYNWPIFVEQSKLPYWKTILYWSELPYFYGWMLGLRVVPPEITDMRHAWTPNTWTCPVSLALVGGAMALNWQHGRAVAGSALPGSRTGRSEWAMVGLVLTFGLPVGWMVLMQATGKTMFTPRYLLPAVAGLAILLAYGVRHLAIRPAAILAAGIWMLLTTSTLWTALQPWRLVRPSVEEIVNLPNPAQPVLLNVQHFLPIKHYYRDELPQVLHVFWIMTYPQPRDPGLGLRALLRNPRAPRFEDRGSFLKTHSRFYLDCHKVDDGEIVQALGGIQTPIIRETDEYIVYEVFRPNR